MPPDLGAVLPLPHGYIFGSERLRGENTMSTATVRALRTQVYVPPEASAKYAGIWTIVKVNPTSYALERDVAGRLQRLRAPHAAVEDVPEGLTETAAGTAQDAPLPAYRAPFDLGAVVRWSRAPAKARGTVFVVLKDDGGPEVARIARLGGDGGRYWRRIPAAALSAVPEADLAGLR